MKYTTVIHLSLSSRKSGHSFRVLLKFTNFFVTSGDGTFMTRGLSLITLSRGDTSVLVLTQNFYPTLPFLTYRVEGLGPLS